MSPVAGGPPTPQENAEVLQIAANLRLVPKDRDPSRWREAARDLALAVAGHRLLVIVADDEAEAACTPHAIDGPNGRLILAFTDEEAAQAWAAQRHPADTAPARWMTFPAQAPAGERAGGRAWTELLDTARAARLVVNPVGPHSFTLAQDDLAVRPRLRARTSAAGGDPWLDLGARAAARARDRELAAAFQEAVDARDDARLEQLRPQLAEINAIGSILLAAANRMRTGRWGLDHGRLGAGAGELVFGAIGLGRHGDIPGCIDGLLESVGRLEPLLQSDAEPSGDPAAELRRHLAGIGLVLQEIATSYRAEEVLETRARLPAYASVKDGGR